MLFFFLSLISLFAATAHAGPSRCEVLYKKGKQKLLEEMRKYEDFYMQYRWAEFRIRLMLYEDVWQARQLSNDPLSKEKRELGRTREQRLEDSLKKWEAESALSSKGFIVQLYRVQQTHEWLRPACIEKNYQDCTDESLKPLYQMMDEMRVVFEHIKEQEIEFRKSVLDTVAGRNGLYPEDTLEPADLHSDFYDRFVSERERGRYDEDKNMIKAFAAATDLVEWRFAGDNCCLECLRK